MRELNGLLSFASPTQSVQDDNISRLERVQCSIRFRRAEEEWI